MELTLTDDEAVYLREAIAGRHALEVWVGDGTYSAPGDVDDQDLYFRLGGTFTELLQQVQSLGRARSDSGKRLKALWQASELYRRPTVFL